MAPLVVLSKPGRGSRTVFHHLLQLARSRNAVKQKRLLPYYFTVLTRSCCRNAALQCFSASLHQLLTYIKAFLLIRTWHRERSAISLHAIKIFSQLYRFIVETLSLPLSLHRALLSCSIPAFPSLMPVPFGAALS